MKWRKNHLPLTVPFTTTNIFFKTWLAFGHILEHFWEFKENSFETQNFRVLEGREWQKTFRSKKNLSTVPPAEYSNLTMSYYKSLRVKWGGGADSLIGPAVHYTSNSSFETSLRCHLRIKAAGFHQMSMLGILKKPFLLKFQSFHLIGRF